MDLTKYGISNDSELLAIALTHTSYSNEHNYISNYERLEFLGDAVLEVVISEYFYLNSKLSEGEMTKKRSSYVCEEALAYYAKKINIPSVVRMGANAVANDTIIADVFEAVIAVIFLERGFEVAKKFITDICVDEILKGSVFLSDYKSYLQELAQTDEKSITYRIINETGPAHDKTFEVEVLVDGLVFARGIGKSKKGAEQDAAKNAILLSSGGLDEVTEN